MSILDSDGIFRAECHCHMPLNIYVRGLSVRTPRSLLNSIKYMLLQDVSETPCYKYNVRSVIPCCFNSDLGITSELVP